MVTSARAVLGVKTGTQNHQLSLKQFRARAMVQRRRLPRVIGQGELDDQVAGGGQAWANNQARTPADADDSWPSSAFGGSQTKCHAACRVIDDPVLLDAAPWHTLSARPNIHARVQATPLRTAAAPQRRLPERCQPLDAPTHAGTLPEHHLALQPDNQAERAKA
jgi:hypothetical protein